MQNDCFVEMSENFVIFSYYVRSNNRTSFEGNYLLTEVPRFLKIIWWRVKAVEKKTSSPLDYYACVQ